MESWFKQLLCVLLDVVEVPPASRLINFLDKIVNVWVCVLYYVIYAQGQTQYVSHVKECDSVFFKLFLFSSVKVSYTWRYIRMLLFVWYTLVMQFRNFYLLSFFLQFKAYFVLVFKLCPFLLCSFF